MAAEQTKKTIQMLRKAYSMEVETVSNYLALSVHLDGVRAEAIKRSLADDIQEELNHATQLANRIKQLGGAVPGSKELEFDQNSLQPPEDPTDLVNVIHGVIEAENSAIEHYKQVIRHTDGDDYVTQDLCIGLLSEEESHRTQFEGFLREYESMAAAV